MKRQLHIQELRSFLLLWASQAVSELGTAMTEYALIVWAYGQEGTASSVTRLTLCAFMPTILLRFAAGALADRWDKKRVMLACDLFAALGTAAVFALHAASALRVWQLYLINLLLSGMNAFQVPAAFVATSLLVPKAHYARAGALQGLSGSVIAILAPALGSALLELGGLRLVLTCDLFSFLVAFLVLLLCIRIPEAKRAPGEREPLRQSLLGGVRWLREHRAILRLSLFFAAVNFLAKLGDDGLLSPFVLARTGNDQRLLGLAQSAVAAGLMAGSLLMTAVKPARRKARFICVACAAVFCGNIVLGLTARPWLWCAALFFSYLAAVWMNVHLTTVLREQVPVEMQGRVFSASDTLKNGSIPLGLLLGGLLADGVFEPFMATDSPIQRLLSRVFGAGPGVGIAVMFTAVGAFGVALSLSRLGKAMCRELDGEGERRHG